MRKLNLGCGFDKRADSINADVFAKCAPDVLFDLEHTPWPFRDNTFDHILMKHVLEHVGAAFPDFCRIMRELYRVAASGGTIEIHVPHYRHDSWWADPSHVRGFTPMTFQMLSRRQNDAWIAARANFTMLAYVMDVDFELKDAHYVYDPHWWQRVQAGELTEAALRERAEREWGVFAELRVTLTAVKA